MKEKSISILESPHLDDKGLWYFRNDVDVEFCEVYQRKPGGGVTASDMYKTEAKALRAAIKSMKERKREIDNKLKNFKERLKR